jgi:hypothetical protein
MRQGLKRFFNPALSLAEITFDKDKISNPV